MGNFASTGAKSLKYNNKLRNKYRKKKHEAWEQLANKTKYKKLDYKKASEEELNIYREKAKANRKADKNRLGIILFLTVIASALVLYGIYFLIQYIDFSYIQSFIKNLFN
jgi:hypothetical protein